MQGYDPLPNGDMLLVPLNLIPTPVKEKLDQSTQSSEAIEALMVAPSLKSNHLSDDQKRLHWETYAKSTERQEEMFNKVFESVFDEQKDYVVSELERTGNLPIQLDDEKTAKKFQPAIELVYQSGFDEAV